MENKYPSIIKTLMYPFLFAMIITALFSYVIYTLSLNYYEKNNHNQNVQSLKLNAQIIQRNKEMEQILINDLI